jgi:iron complex outermembrane recepter protein
MLGLGTVTVVNAAADNDCPAPPCSVAKSEDASTLEEIVVTGTHIRGTEAAGSKLIVIDREQIDTSGHGRIEDVLASVTQNFGRANAAVRSGKEVDNYNRGAEVQLRGLGLGTTLTLVNGQRQGASGFQGSFTDISGIPVSAIERIEILPEGAEALYGGDAIGGVVNIILRKDFAGFETRARLGTASGDARERSIAQLWGHRWSSGHLLVGYQFDDSAALPCSARAYCAANADFTRFGGSDLRGVGSNPGTIVDRGTLAPIAAIPHGQDGTHLTAAQLLPGASNHTNTVTGTDLLPSQRMHSAFLNASIKVAEHWELAFDGRYSSRHFESSFPQPADYFTVPEANAFNHLGAPVVIAYDFTQDVGPVVDSGPTETSFVSTNLKGILAGGWKINLSSAYSRSRMEFVETNILNYDAIDAALSSADPATALNLFGDGSHSSAPALADLRRQNTVYRGPNVFTTTSGNVMADGPLMNAPAGIIRAAVGVEYRHEHSVGLNIADRAENRARQVFAGFLEFAVPVVPAQKQSTAGRVDLSLAGRYETYSDVGATFNPKVGVSWQPVQMVKLRGTWGTSFRAPPFSLSNPDQIGDAAIQDVSDPRSPTGQTRALLLFGPSPNQQPETARTWTLGMDLTPPAAPNLSLSLTYFDVDYRGKIEVPATLAALFLTQEAELAPLITRNPTRAQIDAVCIKPPVPGGSCDQPIDAILDKRMRNISSLRTRGVDAAFDYSLDTISGKWSLGLNGTYTIALKQQITAPAPVVDFIDTVGSPLRLRLAAHLTWTMHGWRVQSTVNHAGGYRDPGSVPTRPVGAWTTVDLNAGYRVGGGYGGFANTQFDVGVINAFNRRPPFVNQFDRESGTLGYDSANASLLGRQVSLQIVKRWGQ